MRQIYSIIWINLVVVSFNGEFNDFTSTLSLSVIGECVIGKPCSISCKVPDIKNIISFSRFHEGRVGGCFEGKCHSTFGYDMQLYNKSNVILTIPKYDKTSSGIWKCSYNTMESNAIVLDAYDPPTAMPQTQYVLAAAEEAFSLNCDVNEHGWNYSITWFKDGKKITNNRYDNDVFNKRLTIAEVNKLDNGTYWCVLAVPPGSSNIRNGPNIRLNIFEQRCKGAPTATQYVSAVVDETFSLNCDVDEHGHSNYNIIWYKDGNRITDNRYNNDVFNKTLTIANVNELDNGTYWCVLAVPTWSRNISNGPKIRLNIFEQRCKEMVDIQNNQHTLLAVLCTLLVIGIFNCAVPMVKVLEEIKNKFRGIWKIPKTNKDTTVEHDNEKEETSITGILPEYKDDKEETRISIDEREDPRNILRLPNIKDPSEEMIPLNMRK